MAKPIYDCLFTKYANLFIKHENQLRKQKLDSRRLTSIQSLTGPKRCALLNYQPLGLTHKAGGLHL
jgi:hypothetical protein